MCEVTDPLGNFGQAFRSVPHAVEAAHHRQENLGSADVAGGFVATNVLLAGLHRQTQRRTPFGITGDPDDATGHAPNVIGLGCQEARVRAAKAHRDTKALSRSNCDFKPHLSGAAHEGQEQRINCRDGNRPRRPGRVGHHRMILQLAVGVGHLHEAAKNVIAELKGLGAHDAHFNAHWRRTAQDHRDGLGMGVSVQQEDIAFAPGNIPRHGHGFGGGGWFIQQRCSRERQTTQISNHGLPSQQHFHATLGDLGLIGRVLGVPTWVAEDGALDDRGDQAIVVSRTNRTFEHTIFGHHRPQRGRRLRLRSRRTETQRIIVPNGIGDGFKQQVAHRRNTERRKHGLLVFGTWPKVTRSEAVGWVEVIG